MQFKPDVQKQMNMESRTTARSRIPTAISKIIRIEVRTFSAEPCGRIVIG